MSDVPAGGSEPILLLGDDGTPPADTAWRWVTNQSWPGWRVEVLTADTSDAQIEWGTAPRPRQWHPTWARTEPIEGASEVRFFKVATDPRAMLAARDDAALMVLGLRTHRFLQAMVTGSTTEWVLHHPTVPLVVASAPEPVHRATVFADGSEHAAAALRAFLRLPLAAGTRTLVVSVDDGRTDTAAADETARLLEGRVAEVDTVTLEGSPTPTILRHLEGSTPDLAVLGTRGLTGWQRLRLGSTASAVARTAGCTCLVASTDSFRMGDDGGE